MRYTYTLALAVGMFVASGSKGSAFDTKWHADATRAAMDQNGFSSEARLLCQFENYITDYYSGIDSDAGAKAIPAAGPAPAAAAPAPTPPIPGGSASAAAAAPAVASGAAVAPPAPEAPEAARRRAQIDWALKQDEIKNDRNGQWAVDAKASTSYNDAQGTAPFSAGQATGVPNVEALGNNGMAWAAKTPDGGIEWLELKYAKPVFATTVRVRESLGPGAIIKVELYDDQGAAHAVWSGMDTTKGLDYLVVEIPKTAYKTDRVRLTLATNTVSGWQEIDAVQLVGSDQAATTTAAVR